MKKLFFLSFAFLFILVKQASAHCPLCTVGAAAVAGGAVWLGVKLVVVGVFIGAFAVSLGFWAGRIIKRKFIPMQKPVLIIVSFLTTVIPLISILSNEHAVYPIYISMAGDYGSLLNRTYLLDQFFLGSLIGGVIVSLAPLISKKITSLRSGRTIAFQGSALTLVLLILIGVVLQVLK